MARKEKKLPKKQNMKTDSAKGGTTEGGVGISWTTGKRKLKDFIPYEHNPRRLTEKQYEDLKKSLQKFNLAEIPAVNTDNQLLAGHQRIKIMLELYGPNHEIDVRIPNRKLSVKECQEYNVRSNKNTGEWDFDILANNFEIDDLKDWGFTEDELSINLADEDIEITEDDVPEPPEKPKTEHGRIYQLGQHRLMCGDSTKDDDVKRLMGIEKAICVFTDPPYGVSIGKKNLMLNSFQKAGRNHDDLKMDDMKPEELKEMLLKCFTLWRSFMADDCSVFVCSPQGGGLGMMMMMMNAGLEVKHILNWVKNAPTFSMGRLDYDYQHEPILFTWTKTHKRYKRGKWNTSLWTVNKPMANKEHPTMKPVELPANAILNHTDKEDIVVDMFGGSGSTLVAAEQTNRQARLMEISPKYCDVIVQRYCNYKSIDSAKVFETGVAE